MCRDGAARAAGPLRWIVASPPALPPGLVLTGKAYVVAIPIGTLVLAFTSDSFLVEERV